MKKFLQFAVLVIAMASCQKEPNVSSVVEETPNQLTDEAALHRVSIEEAEANVLSFLSEMRGATRGSEPVTISSKFSKGGFGYATKSGSVDEQPLVYVFNIGNEDGYVIASGDDRAPQVLCIMDKGSFAENEELTEPAMIALLSRIDTDYRMAVGLPIVDREGNTVLPEQYGYFEKKDSPDTRAKDATASSTPVNGVAYYDTTPWTTNVSIGTILPCTWGQDPPFNGKCRTSTGAIARAGCVPVAVAQIMYHWGVNATYNGVNYDWSLMHSIIDSDSFFYELLRAWSQVQSLLVALGDPNNLDADYDYDSGVMFENPRIARTFQNFGYADGGTITEYSLVDLKNALKNGPVLGHGFCYEITHVKKTKILGITIKTVRWITYDEGHTWVYDNYIERSCMRLGFNGNNEVIYTQPLRETLVHCNMGSNLERHNGYFYSGVYDAEHPVTRSTSETETTNGTESIYQYDLKMVTNIHP